MDPVAWNVRKGGQEFKNRQFLLGKNRTGRCPVLGFLVFIRGSVNSIVTSCPFPSNSHFSNLSVRILAFS